MNESTLKTEFIDKYNAIGHQQFYKYLLGNAIDKLVKIQDGEYKGVSPEIEFLDNADKFLVLYRRENKPIYLELSKIYRKAGHKIYRAMLKKGMSKKNGRFLNLV